MTENTAAQQIDAIINKAGDWRRWKLSQLRAVINKADPVAVEEVKWKKPSKPEGVPVWSHDGIVYRRYTQKGGAFNVSKRSEST